MTPETIAYIQMGSTVVVTIANVLLAIFTFNYVRLTGRMVEHMHAQRMGAVFVDLEFDGWSAYFTVGNNGTAPVTDINLDVEENVKWSRSGVAKLDVVKHGISYLPAGRTLKFYLGPPDWKSVEAGPSVVRVSVTYKTDSQPHQGEFVIDMAQYLGSSSKTSPIDRLVSAVEELARARSRNHLPLMPFMESKKLCLECAEKIPWKARRCSHCLAMQPAAKEAEAPAEQTSDHKEDESDQSGAPHGDEADFSSEVQELGADAERSGDTSIALAINEQAPISDETLADPDLTKADATPDMNEPNPEVTPNSG